MNDAVFQSLRLPSYEESACSPDLGDQLGLRIAAPSKVPAGAPLPLCGTLRLPLDVARRIRPDPVEAVVVVVVDRERKAPFAFSLVPDKDPMPREETPEEEPPPSTAKVTSYFNVDLRTFGSDLPRRPGKYSVFAMLRAWRSNVIEVEQATGEEP